jgi:hypothetical protein
MTDVYVIRNQLGHYWGKSKAWADGSDAKAVMRVRHEDEAINTLFELGSADFELRGEILCVEVTERGEPIIEPSQIPLFVAVDDAEDIDGIEQAEVIDEVESDNNGLTSGPESEPESETTTT